MLLITGINCIVSIKCNILCISSKTRSRTSNKNNGKLRSLFALTCLI